MHGITRIPSGFAGDALAIERASDVLIKAEDPIIVCDDAVGYAAAWDEVRKLAELLGAPVLLQSFSSVANFPDDDIHWQGELPGSQRSPSNAYGIVSVLFK